MLHPVQAYARSAKAGLSGKRLLAAILAQCASDLSRALPEAAGLEDLIEALERNRRAWSVIGQEVSDPDSALPAEVRGPLFRLAAFVFQETIDICASPDRARLKPLIDLNRTVAAGFERTVA